MIHGIDTDFEYDWLVAPAAVPSQIWFFITGSRRVSLSPSGDLVIPAPGGEVRHRNPYLYQTIDNVRRPVDGQFAISDDGRIGFRVGPYDKSRPLIIDPRIVYRTTLSGPPIYVNQGTTHERYESSVSGAAVDRAGNLYIVGTDLTGPTLVNPIQSECPAGRCLYVAKLSPDGNKVLYATFLGAPTQPWGYPGVGLMAYLPAAIVCDQDGNVYVTGGTFAAGLPQVNGGQAPSAGGDDAFVVKLDPNGVLKATMLIGGSADDTGTAMTIGRDGFLYVAGTTASNDFPISRSPFLQPISNPPGAFLLKIDPASFSGDNPPTALQYSAIVSDYISAIAADSQGSVYVASRDSIIKVNSNGTHTAKVPFDTGTGHTSVAAMAIDAQDNVIVTGATYSTDFPTTSGAWITSSQPAQIFGSKPFLRKLRAGGMEVEYSTYLSGDGSEYILGLAIDESGNTYISGITYSAQFPLLNSIQSGLTNSFCFGYAYHAQVQAYCYPAAAFITVVKPDGSGLVWSSLLPGAGGGIGLDGQGNVYVAGSSATNPYPGLTGVNALKLSPTGSPISIDSIVNAASFHQGLPAPGGLASMFVRGLQLTGSLVAPTLPWPTELGGVSLTVAGTPAPILSVSNIGEGAQQINFQVPPTAPQTNLIAEVDLTYQGVTSIAVPVRVAPGIFALPDGSGAIQHASDYSLVTPANPAQKGEVLIVYVTGLGSRYTADPPSSAVPNPINLGDMLYAGDTPGYPGLSQINFRLSLNATSGPSQLTLTWIPAWLFGINGTPPDAPVNDSVSNSVTLWIK